MTTTLQKPLRWSSTRVCPRKARYEADDAPARAWTQDEEWIFQRGHALEDAYARMLGAGGTEFVREKKVTWPGGVGHEDFFIPADGLVVECLSSDNPTAEQIAAKLLQLAGYVMYDPDAGEYGILVLLKSSVAPEKVVFQLTDEWRSRVEEKVAAVMAAPLPERVCSRPQDAYGRFCPFAQHCFEGWTAPPLDEVDTPEAREATLAFAQAKQNERAAQAVYNAAKEQRELIQARLADVVPVGKVSVGPFEVRRIHYAGRRTFKLPLAEQDSRFADNLIAEFVQVGDPYDVFKVDRVTSDEALLADGFGAHPFDEPLEGAA